MYTECQSIKVISDTFHYCVNLENDDIAHVSTFVIYLRSAFLYLFASQFPIVTFFLRTVNKRETAVKYQRRTMPVRDTYLIERPLWGERGWVEFWWSASGTRAVHTGGNTRRLDGGELIFIAPAGHRWYPDITKFAFMTPPMQRRVVSVFLKEETHL